MENIIEPTMEFDFSKLFLATPSSLTGGAYFTRIFLNSKPLYMQTPKCLTKQGFVKSGKKIYVDLMFDNNDTMLIQWLENLETQCHELIFEKGTQWFETPLEKNDIETTFTSPIKVFKSGKFYLLRVNVKPNVKIYNEMDEIISLETITPEMHMISILEIQGIKFTSRNFQIEIELKQSMVVRPDPFLDECFIRKPNNRMITKEPVNAVTSPYLIQSNRETDAPVLDVDVEPEFENKIKNNVCGLKEEMRMPEMIDNSNELTEIHLDTLDDNIESISLKKPDQVYYKIYKAAREKAKQAKKEAILAYLDAKNIKKTYMLSDIEDSDSDLDNSFENASEVSENEDY